MSCKPNTTYTISKKAGLSFRIATFSDIPKIGSTYNSTQANHTGTSITIQTGEKDNYIGFVCFSTSNGDTGTYKEMYETVQVEEGEIATTYEAYIEPTIYIKKSNNEYEKLLGKEENWTSKVELGLEDLKNKHTELENQEESIENAITEIYNQQEILKSMMPIGSTMQWFADVIPKNWLLCNGQAVNRTEYSELFSTLGTKYGTGNGSTTFNLPNLKGKVAVGLDVNDTEFNTLGKTGGEKKHQLTINELPEHQMSFKDGGKLLVASGNTYGVPDYVIKNGQTLYSNPIGGNQSHNNLQPYIVCQYIMKVK